MLSAPLKATRRKIAPAVVADPLAPLFGDLT
jgi:hypothetical protein